MCSVQGQPVRRCVRVTRWEAVAEWPRACVAAAVTEAVALAVPAAVDSEEDSAAEGLKRSAYCLSALGLMPSRADRPAVT